MKNKILLILLLFTSCRSVQRHKIVTDKVTESTEKGTRTIVSKGDSVIFVPKIVYANDTIVKVHENVILRTIYKDGKVSQIDCKQKEQKIIEEYLKSQEVNEHTKQKDVEKEPIKAIWFLYIGIIILLSIFVNNLTKRH